VSSDAGIGASGADDCVDGAEPGESPVHAAPSRAIESSKQMAVVLGGPAIAVDDPSMFASPLIR